MYFEGPTIFSYGSHFPIATHVTNARGERAVIFTRETYSVTTQKHMSCDHIGEYPEGKPRCSFCKQLVDWPDIYSESFGGPSRWPCGCSPSVEVQCYTCHAKEAGIETDPYGEEDWDD